MGIGTVEAEEQVEVGEVVELSRVVDESHAVLVGSFRRVGVGTVKDPDAEGGDGAGVAGFGYREVLGEVEEVQEGDTAWGGGFLRSGLIEVFAIVLAGPERGRRKEKRGSGLD